MIISHKSNRAVEKKDSRFSIFPSGNDWAPNLLILMHILKNVSG